MGYVLKILSILPAAFELAGKLLDALKEANARRREDSIEKARTEKHAAIDAAIDGEKKP